MKDRLIPIIGGLIISFVISVICNMVGYGFSIAESIPGLLILIIFSLIGYILSFIVPIKKISAVLWISLVAILAASPISPIAGTVIQHVSNVSLMSVVTPILAYAGVLVGKDWDAFKKVGITGVIVSIFVLSGTFLVSSMLGDLFMKIFN